MKQTVKTSRTSGTLDRPIEETVATLLHEMVHLYNLEHNIQDCSRGRTSGGMSGVPIPPTKKTTWKWTCPTCGQIARTTCLKMEQQLVCGICGVSMYHD